MKKLEKAITKYGDIEIGCYGATYAIDLENASDLCEICDLRIVTENQESLPGVSIEEDENERHKSADSVDGNYFAAIFYND